MIPTEAAESIWFEKMRGVGSSSALSVCPLTIHARNRQESGKHVQNGTEAHKATYRLTHTNRLARAAKESNGQIDQDRQLRGRAQEEKDKGRSAKKKRND